MRTGTVGPRRARTVVWNGTRALEALLRWAIGRYRVAGLPPPRPRSVTFSADPTRCYGSLGVAEGEHAEDIVLCIADRSACTTSGCATFAPRPASVVLHELAHTWLAQQLDARRRAAYARHLHLAWDNFLDGWEQRAGEYAADVLAWGVQAGPRPLGRQAEPSVASLGDDFRLLTGRSPAWCGTGRGEEATPPGCG